MPFPANSQFSELIERAQQQLDSELPFVIYRKPGNEQVIGLFQDTPTNFRINNFKESGFVFVPFDSAKEAILLRPNEELIADCNPSFSNKSSLSRLIQTGREEHLALVHRAVNDIKDHKFDKVIVSQKIETSTQKSPFEIFESALDKYDNVFCYLWFHTKTDIWIGASPEVFLKAKGEEVRTVSLAGTMKTKNNQKPTWGRKEIEEQQMVTDYINACFSKSLEKVTISKAETVRAGNIWHLRSSISGEKRKDFNIKNLIDDLHPTPAVCGFPKEKALRFIRENEVYDRDYYTGFLGDINLRSNDVNLFVNLRCMQLSGADASIFVGGGITKDSIPEMEWEEIQHKSQTMISLL